MIYILKNIHSSAMNDYCFPYTDLYIAFQMLKTKIYQHKYYFLFIITSETSWIGKF